MEDQFYDSLDEEVFSDCRTFPGEHNIRKNNKCKLHVTVPKIQVPESKLCDVSEIIPLYKQDTLKTNVKTSKKNPLIRDKKVDRITTVEKKPRTYLNLFYNKIKFPCRADGDSSWNKETSDTARAICGSARKSMIDTSRSGDCYGDRDENSSTEDESFLEKVVPRDKDEKKFSQSTPRLTSVSQNFIGLRSDSEQLLRPCVKERKRIVSKPSLVISSITVNEAADKLKILRRRQTYGQKASYRNKILLQEAEVLRNLRTKFKQESK